MSSSSGIEIFLNRSEDQLADHSSPIELLKRLESDIEGSLPAGFFEEVSPREPEDTLIIRGKFKQTSKSEWTEEAELRDRDFQRSEFSDLPEGSIPIEKFSEVMNKEYNSIISHQYDHCSECAGDPESVCDECDGDTTYECDTCSDGYEPCTDCNGEGENPCNRCNATGEVTCPTCDGTPHSSCDSCGGNGSKTIEESCPNCSLGTISVEETCSQCQGQGSIKEDGEFKSCPRCSGIVFTGNGKVEVEKTCPQCSGRGSTRRNITCDECNGTGEWECRDCSATGSVGCSACEGREVIVCDGCQGDGEIVCTDCNGSGDHSCEQCQDGIRVCSVCGGDGETHKVEFRRTTIMWKTSEKFSADLPYGVENPNWRNVEPHIVAHRTSDQEATVRGPSTIDVEKIGSAVYEKIDVKYALARTLTYDYGERNFRIREVNGSIYYTDYPSSKKSTSGGTGLFGKLKNLF